MDVYPLIFQPIFKPKVWGGRKLESLLGKNLSPELPIGESWELADFETESSIVANGPECGKTLHDVLQLWGEKLMGQTPLAYGRFPLVLKFLDARQPLSVQVHPGRHSPRQQKIREPIKDEAWYVVDAENGAWIHHGLAPGTTRETVKRAVLQGQVESVLRRLPARKGHAYYLPGGTIHTLGGGILVAEVQTLADITYRLFDWDRVEPGTGQPRELHIDQALDCTVFDGPLSEYEQRPEHLASVWTSVTNLVRCNAFVMERVRMVAGVDQELPFSEMMIWMVLEGRVSLSFSGAGSPMEFRPGDTVLLPAGLRSGRVRSVEPSMWLEISVPIPSDLANYPRPDRKAELESDTLEKGLVQISIRQQNVNPQVGSGFIGKQDHCDPTKK
ncbi:MAG: type I phosphomannose isomerase catalytic subunit [Planctomycetota bacterium]